MCWTLNRTCTYPVTLLWNTVFLPSGSLRYRFCSGCYSLKLFPAPQFSILLSGRFVHPWPCLNQQRLAQPFILRANIIARSRFLLPGDIPSTIYETAAMFLAAHSCHLLYLPPYRTNTNEGHHLARASSHCADASFVSLECPFTKVQLEQRQDWWGWRFCPRNRIQHQREGMLVTHLNRPDFFTHRLLPLLGTRIRENRYRWCLQVEPRRQLDTFVRLGRQCKVELLGC